MSYYEICEKLAQGWIKKWNDEQQVPYAYDASDWVGYDNKKSLTYKVSIQLFFN